MLELLKRWAELEPDVIEEREQDKYTRYFSINGKHINDPGDLPAIEYAVRDAIDGHKEGIPWEVSRSFNLDGVPDGYYAVVYGCLINAPSPAEALLRAYVEYLKKEVPA